jgi:putative transcription antitermination factor YqgF
MGTVTRIELTKDVTEIAAGSFTGYTEGTVQLPASVTSVAAGAFEEGVTLKINHEQKETVVHENVEIQHTLNENGECTGCDAFSLTGILSSDDTTAKEKVERIIVGLPKKMNNEYSENMVRIEPFVNRLRKLLPAIPIEYYDERFTSQLAQRTIIEAGIKKKARQNKALVDEISAVIILQSYLDSRQYNRQI